MLTDRDDIRVAETGEELLIFDVSDDELERTARIIGGVASVATLNFSTAILGNCGRPVWKLAGVFAAQHTINQTGR